jgi:diguanylate cyclase (GGDEF)-like protein
VPARRRLCGRRLPRLGGADRRRPLEALAQDSPRICRYDRMGPLPLRARLQRFDAPFLGIVALAFAATGLRTGGTDWRLVGAAAVGAAVLAVAARIPPRPRVSPSALLVLPIAAEAVIALLRQAQGGNASGYAPLAILPVVWVGLTQRRRAVAAICICTLLMFALPILIVGAPRYPATGWQGVILWSVVAVVVGFGVSVFVDDQRRKAASSSARSHGLDQLVETQTAIATADSNLDAVMKSACEGALSLTGAEGAVVHLLDGADIVWSGAAGVATAHLGLRMKARESLAGECFRTRRTLICGDSETDTRVHRASCRLVGARSMISVPILYAGDVKGVLLVYSASAHDFRGSEASLLALLVNMVGAALVRAELIARLTDQAVTDELTALPNRRAWYRHLDLALARARRNGEPLSVLLLDLDGLKNVNDQQGHAAGDRLLKTVAGCWTHATRTTDLLGRIGGDEFGVVLEMTDEDDANDVVARFDRSLAGRHHASSGIAVWDGEEDAMALMARADADMYAHKRAQATSAR